MGRPGPRKIQKYSLEFKRAAVKLSQLRGVEVQTVAEALDIHPFMLSRWRKEGREGKLRGRGGVLEELRGVPAGEIRRLQALEREHGMLKEEHELLKRAIRYCSARSRRSSGSSRPNEDGLR